MQENKEKNQKTHFGFQEIPYSEKIGKVKNVFDSVANKYDIMNDIMSLGIHRLWKKEFVSKLYTNKKSKLLDVGGGTGDITIAYKKQGGEKAVVLDINENMLNVGKERAEKLGLVSGIEWVLGDAENLNFEDNTFNIYTTAFCIRNVTNIQNALNEAYRVLENDGHFLCLEFSPKVDPIIEPFYDIWSFKVLPKLGKIIAHDSESYQYLAESIRKFPNKTVFSNMIKKAGFKNIKATPLSGGIVYIYSAWK